MNLVSSVGAWARVVGGQPIIEIGSEWASYCLMIYLISHLTARLLDVGLIAFLDCLPDVVYYLVDNLFLNYDSA